MAIEIPEAYGGAGASFFHAVLAVEELSRVDPSVGVLVDVQNTLVVNALLRWGNEDVKRRYLTRLAVNSVGAYALSEAGSGSDAFALTTRGARGRRRLRHQRAQAVDHQRQRSRHVPRLRHGQSRCRLPRHHRLHRRARRLRLHRRARRKTSSASARAAPASWCSRTAACRERTCSARSARATRRRSRR